LWVCKPPREHPVLYSVNVCKLQSIGQDAHEVAYKLTIQTKMLVQSKMYVNRKLNNGGGNSVPPVPVKNVWTFIVGRNQNVYAQYTMLIDRYFYKQRSTKYY
jgi:hypothetical protein